MYELKVFDSFGDERSGGITLWRGRRYRDGLREFYAEFSDYCNFCEDFEFDWHVDPIVKFPRKYRDLIQTRYGYKIKRCSFSCIVRKPVSRFFVWKRVCVPWASKVIVFRRCDNA